MSKRKSVDEAAPRKARKFGDVLQEDSNRPPVSTCFGPREKGICDGKSADEARAKRKATSDGKPDDEAGAETKGTTDGESREQRFTRFRGLKCHACLDVGDHWTSDCPRGIFKKCTDQLIQRRCKVCGLEPSDHWTSECPHAPPFKKPPPPLNLENVIVVAFLSPDETEEDLLELFREFNPIRTSVCKTMNAARTDFDTSFAQVFFVNNEEAKKAEEKFNGYVYRGRSLHVNWVTVKGKPSFGFGLGRAAYDQNFQAFHPCEIERTL